jgi:hypothetical protein
MINNLLHSDPTWYSYIQHQFFKELLAFIFLIIKHEVEHEEMCYKDGTVMLH